MTLLSLTNKKRRPVSSQKTRILVWKTLKTISTKKILKTLKISTKTRTKTLKTRSKTKTLTSVTTWSPLVILLTRGFF